ncbi:MAG TPA: hypothetical protein VJ385_15800 [Fibrobacteria bacterium]|nr:hypothetical protein [Fibrobacteria bacterium]
MSFSVLPAAFAAALFASAAAEETADFEISKPSLTLFHEFGNIERGVEFEKTSFRDYWVQRTGGFIGFTGKHGDRLGMELMLGGIYWNPTFNENASSESVLRYFAGSAPKLDVNYIWGDLEHPYLRVDGGIFQYKYNDYSRNLGEYMFRTSAYPGLVFTGGLTMVDINKPSLTGLKLTHSLGSIFSHDLLITTETEMIPHYDISLSYMFRGDFSNVFKFAAGVEFARLLALKPSVTNPDIKFNRYFTFNDTTYVDNGDYYAQRLKALKPGHTQDSLLFERGKFLADTLGALAAVSADNTLPFSQALAKLDSIFRPQGSSSYDKFDNSSITPVISASLDVKRLLGLDFLGPKDLVLYGEAAILGLQNQPVLYEKVSERTVAMLGFNVPTFRLLETLSIEVERNGSIYPNANQYNQRDIGRKGSTFSAPAQPTIFSSNLEGGYDPADWNKDNLRWSVLANRDIVKGISLTGQVASDNARGYVYPSGRRYWALFRDPGKDWYWMFKLTAKI